MKLHIERFNAPSTTLNLKIIANDKLGARDAAFILPGGPGADHTVYDKYACLQDTADLIFHDPRGCGLSHKGELSSYNMDNYIDDVESMRQQLCLDQIIVIGKSYGAMCALGYAVRYPQFIKKLVLSAGAPSYRFISKAKQNLQERGTLEQIEFCERLWAGQIKNHAELLTYFKLMNPLYAVKPQPSNQISMKGEHFAFEPLNEGFKNNFWHFDFEADLPKIHVPTLILAGQQDWITDVSFSVLMADKIPNAKLKVFTEASHAMESDVTEEYFESIREFIG